MPKVAIVGGGPNGVIAANLLISSGLRDLQIDLFGSGTWGHGLVYGDNELASARQSFTNQNMGVSPRDDQALIVWIDNNKQRLMNSFPEDDLGPDSFPPRQIIGKYFADQIDWAVAQAEHHRVAFNLHCKRVCSVSPNISGGYTIQSEDYSQVVDGVFFCLGNFPPAWGSHLNGQPGYYPEIWGKQVLNEVGSEDKVLIIGSGLSSIDLLWGLHDIGHKGEVVFASRNGLLPSVQARRILFDLPGVFTDMAAQERVSFAQLYQELDRVLGSQNSSADWNTPAWEDFDTNGQDESTAQALVRKLGTLMPAIWERMDDRSKTLFDQHLGAWWNSIHLPMAQHSARLVRQEIDCGRLQIERLEEVKSKKNGRFLASFIGKPNQQFGFDYCFNATGRNLQVQSIDDPLIRSILVQELFLPDPAGGFRVDPATGRSTTEKGAGCYMIGPLTRGSCFYTYVLSQNAKQAEQATTDWKARISAS